MWMHPEHELAPRAAAELRQLAGVSSALHLERVYGGRVARFPCGGLGAHKRGQGAPTGATASAGGPRTRGSALHMNSISGMVLVLIMGYISRLKVGPSRTCFYLALRSFLL